ncbi:MAG: hypothetical protein J7K40_03750 [candidate division Zixibacteria bacterium]|nr:hypothetical protein [candidate division Zixibacteria bacterium]
MLIRRLSAAFIICVILASCGERKDKSSAKQDLASFGSYYAGNISRILNADSLTAVDSLRILENGYYQASFNAQLFKFQKALAKSYFAACHEKCETKKCSPGNIINAAIAHYFDGCSDSVLFLCDLIDKTNKDIPPEVNEIKTTLLTVMSVDWQGKLDDLIKTGDIKTPTGKSFLSIVSMDRAYDPNYWIDNISKKSKGLEQLPLRYAYSYALALSGEVVKAWETIPDYAPFDTAYPPPSFTENLVIGDSTLAQKLYLPINLYIRKQVDEMLLIYLLNSGYAAINPPSAVALKALSQIKKLSAPEIDSPFEASETDSLPGSFDKELTFILSHIEDNQNTSDIFKQLHNPISRAAFLKLLSDKPENDYSPEMTKLINGEINDVRKNINDLPEIIYWQSSIFLSGAIYNVAGPVESFSQLNNIGRVDLSVRNNSPEWLALYARVGLEEGSQISIVTLVSFNITRYYPYAIGLYETMQNYKLLCKYF